MIVRKPAEETATLSPERAEFIAARQLLAELIQLPDLSESFSPDARPSNRTVYSHGVTIWMLILQRLGKGQSLSKVVSEVVNHQRDLLPTNKRVDEYLLSENTSAYSKARQKIPLSVVESFSRKVCDYLGRTSPKAIANRRVFIIDGTTITFPPTAELQRAFPPATNQHGTSVWPVASLMVANEMQSGCALLPQIDPMYGENNSSEAKQARRIVNQLPDNSIVMADANFGVFSVAWASIRASHDFLFRLTASRFKSHVRNAELVEKSQRTKTYRLRWQPSRSERQNNPWLPGDASLEVLIHEVQLENGKKLYLISSLDFDAQAASDLYCRRYDVEFDIRDLKVTMDAENIRAKSVSMVLKELLTSVVAYNLVAQFRRQAAAIGRVEPRRLSFSGVWLSFEDHLLRKQPANELDWQDLYIRALISASNRKLPNRKSPRDYPRQAHSRRQKRTKFEKFKGKKPTPPDVATPPSG